jgi:peptide-methionine (R)-S-oxide reductase
MNPPQQTKLELTEEQWKQILSPQEYRVLRQSGTEYPGTGRFLDDEAQDDGMYCCAGCANPLYPAKTKFRSGCGWPSFFEEIAPGSIVLHRDTTHGMVRTEMRCAVCDGHLGHVFDDAPHMPTGKRHCVNGTALIFVPRGRDPQQALTVHRAAQHRA